ncbi:hypothetical protein SH668x_002042 [Planctomicrobium sp. SH668]|uniref:hypothetical protein n=1 Tax=Planctomicrobium sp. SH668 TaxID=3448126 RepID=UPI003F5B4E43
MKYNFAFACLVCAISLAAAASEVYSGGKPPQGSWSATGVKSKVGLAVPYDDQTKALICTNRSVPPNWVIVGIRHCVNCNGLGRNAWIIQRLPNYPGADLIICSCQPVPPGWAVVEEMKSHYCGPGMWGVRIRKI